MKNRDYNLGYKAGYLAGSIAGGTEDLSKSISDEVKTLLKKPMHKVNEMMVLIADKKMDATLRELCIVLQVGKLLGLPPSHEH